jgi:hypothetical protein
VLPTYFCNFQNNPKSTIAYWAKNCPIWSPCGPSISFSPDLEQESSLKAKPMLHFIFSVARVASRRDADAAGKGQAFAVEPDLVDNDFSSFFHQIQIK